MNIRKHFLILKQLYFTLLITTCSFGYEEIFNSLFGIFLGGSIIFIWLVNKKKDELNKKVKVLLKNSYIGLLFMLFAGIFWIFVEKFCDTFSIMKYIQGHAIWHIGVSLGGYLISLLLVGISLDRKHQLPLYNVSDKSINQK